jgi:hypothetical protein
MVSPALTTSVEQRCYNTKTPKCRSCELLWVVYLRILQDPSQSSDRGDMRRMSGACGGPHVERR